MADRGSLCKPAPENDIALEYEVRAFRSLLQWEMSLCERCSGGKVMQNPTWNSVVSGSQGSQKKWGCLSQQRSQALEQGNQLCQQVPEGNLSWDLHTPQSESQSGDHSPFGTLQRAEMRWPSAFPQEDWHKCPPQKSSAFTAYKSEDCFPLRVSWREGARNIQLWG